jgi:MtN3 and saliva related transmembrane protein
MTVFGFIAAVFTTGCWLPQVRRTWRTRSTSDISWLYLTVLTTGVSLWAVYGILRADIVIFLANAVTVLFLGTLIYVKLAERRLSASS